MVVASGSETLLPRFSANRDTQVAQALFLNGTWAALAISIVLFIPLVVLMPDFLRLWISSEFSRESAAIGQLVALSYITQGAFTPPATFFRGAGKPWFVTVVIAFAGIVTLLFSVLLIPTHGVMGVGYAYLLGSIAHFLGVVVGWFYMFGSSSVVPLIRSVGLPMVMGGIAFAAEIAIKRWAGELSWVGLFTLGGLFAGLTGLLVIGADWVLGGESPSKVLLERIGKSSKVDAFLGYLRAKRIF
jgi:O-antigen/teichoic acid export membrane protein